MATPGPCPCATTSIMEFVAFLKLLLWNYLISDSSGALFFYIKTRNHGDVTIKGQLLQKIRYVVRQLLHEFRYQTFSSSAGSGRAGSSTAGSARVGSPSF